MKRVTSTLLELLMVVVEIVIASFVITETFRRASTPTVPDGFAWRVNSRKITSEEKDALMSEISADSSFASWLSPQQ